MKLKDLSGREVSVNINKDKYPIKEKSASKLQKRVGEFLVELFPRHTILEEFKIPNSRLFIDFYLPGVGLIVEADGQQHGSHNSFFHKSFNQLNFSKQVERDRQKHEWAAINGIQLVRVEDGVTKESLKALIDEQ